MAMKIPQYKQTEHARCLIKNVTLKHQTSFFPEFSLVTMKNQEKKAEKNRVMHTLSYMYIQTTFFSKKRQNFI